MWRGQLRNRRRKANGRAMIEDGEAMGSVEWAA
jgi:hypothetical protein